MLHWSHVQSLTLPHWDGFFYLFIFLILPKGNAESVVRCFLLFCLLHSTPVVSFGGRSRLYWNCLISNLLTCTFHIDCNTSTDMVFRKCAQAEKELSQKLHKLWHTWTKRQSLCIQMSSRVANKGGKKAPVNLKQQILSVNLKTHKRIIDCQNNTNLFTVSRLRCVDVCVCSVPVQTHEM